MENFKDRFVSYKLTQPPELIKMLIKQFLEDSKIDVPQKIFSLPQDLILEETTFQQPMNNETKNNQTKKSDIKNNPITSNNNLKFDEAFNLAVKINPEVSKYKDFLYKTAKLESNFNNIQNKAGAPYYGFFLMGKDLIKETTGLTVNEFNKDPVQLILGAVKLYKTNMKILKSIGAYDLCKSKGYSDDAIMAGAWLGGPGGVKKYITNLGDPSDSHWYNNKGGTSVSKRMNNWNYV